MRLLALSLKTLHAELAPNVQKHHDTHKAQRCHQDCSRSNLQTWTVICVELKNIIRSPDSCSSTASGAGSCSCASLCGLENEKKIYNVSKKSHEMDASLSLGRLVERFEFVTREASITEPEKNVQVEANVKRLAM